MFPWNGQGTSAKMICTLNKTWIPRETTCYEDIYNKKALLSYAISLYNAYSRVLKKAEIQYKAHLIKTLDYFFLGKNEKYNAYIFIL